MSLLKMWPKMVPKLRNCGRYATRTSRRSLSESEHPCVCPRNHARRKKRKTSSDNIFNVLSGGNTRLLFEGVFENWAIFQRNGCVARGAARWALVKQISCCRFLREVAPCNSKLVSHDRHPQTPTLDSRGKHDELLVNGNYCLCIARRKSC